MMVSVFYLDALNKPDFCMMLAVGVHAFTIAETSSLVTFRKCSYRFNTIISKGFPDFGHGFQGFFKGVQNFTYRHNDDITLNFIT